MGREKHKRSSIHVNWIVLNNDWEAGFCRIAKSHLPAIAYVKSQGLGLEVTYRHGARNHIYRPNFNRFASYGCWPSRNSATPLSWKRSSENG